MGAGVDIVRDTVDEGGLTGKITVGATEVQISSTPELLLFTGILLKADTTNTGIVYIGFGPSVTENSGYPLYAGHELALPVNRLSRLWFISDTADQVFYWLAL